MFIEHKCDEPDLQIRSNQENPKLCPVCQSGQIWKSPKNGRIQSRQFL